jgi:hypothetical protein
MTKKISLAELVAIVVAVAYAVVPAKALAQSPSQASVVTDTYKPPVRGAPAGRSYGASRDLQVRDCASH